MYESQGWWFPDNETHFPKMLAKSASQGGPTEYQYQVRNQSLNYVKQNCVALDIGANVGLWSRDLVKHFDCVIAFEPVAIFRDCLLKNVPATNLILHDCALGKENSRINMIVTEGNTGHSHVDSNSFGQGQIEMKTLDTMNLPVANYIKLDCEGYEHNIILGGENYIKSCRPIIVVEQKFHKDTGIVDTGETVELLKLWGAKLLQRVRHDLIMGW